LFAKFKSNYQEKSTTTFIPFLLIIYLIVSNKILLLLYIEYFEWKLPFNYYEFKYYNYMVNIKVKLLVRNIINEGLYKSGEY